MYEDFSFSCLIKMLAAEQVKSLKNLDVIDMERY